MNKHSLKNILILLGLTLCWSEILFSAESISQFKNLALSTCTKTKCLTLKTEQANTGKISPIYSFKQFQVELVSVENLVNKEIDKVFLNLTGHSGYIDFQNNRLLIKINKKEILFNLEDLTYEEFYD